MPKIVNITIAGILLLLCSSLAQAQKLTVVSETDQFTDYHFSNDSLKISHAYEFLVETGSENAYTISEQRVTTRTLERNPDSLIDVFELSDSNTPVFDIVNPGMFRGKPVSNLRFHPVRFSAENPGDMVIVREARFRVYKPRMTPQAQRLSSQGVQNEQSPLASGEWYKIPIEQKGIYQIDSEYLVELGINTGQLNPDHIQIWAYPGGELPRPNSAERPELAQIPILVEGNNSGSFNETDRILFYADSPHQIFRDAASNEFSHQLHRYSDFHHVYLQISPNEDSKRLTVLPDAGTGTPITEFRDFTWLEEDLFKSEPTIRSGLEWYGMRLSNSSGQQQRTIFDETIPGLIPGRDMEVDIQFVGRSTQTMSMGFSYNGSNIGSVNVGRITSYRSETGLSGLLRTFSTTVSTQANEELQLGAQLNAPEPTSEAFIDWVRITYDRALQAKDDILQIYSPPSISNQTGTYQLRGFSSTPLVMEITDPINPILLEVSGAGSQFNFSYEHQEHHRFMAQSSFHTPEMGSRVENQNLRGISSYPDYVIVTSDFFFDLANEWADYRQDKDGYQTVVVTQEQIFNEFSGGTPDVTAIRDYIKFLYDRALASGRDPLQHLLLFGDATYDYKDIIGGSITNHVFTFQSDESLNRSDSYGSDDFFGLLDDNEGAWRWPGNERIDIGLGRFPVNTIAEARTVMEKTREYEDGTNTGNWRTRFTFASDDDFPDVETNRDLHLLNADGTANLIDKTESATKIDKIYMLSYPVETSAAGRRVPGATQDFINAFNKGSLVINYSGHGSQYVLADEFLFTDEMIPRLTNRDKPSIFVTATCQFGRYDDIDSKSGAEQTLLWDQGGIVAAFTTTRVVFTNVTPGSNNYGLNQQLTRQMVERDQQGRPQQLGDIYRNTKNTSQGAGFNARKFILLGDPAMRIGLPEAKAEITRINNIDLETAPDTVLQIRALDRMNIEGIITDPQGNPMPDFNGETTITVFDSERVVNLPDKNWVQEGRCYQPNCQYSVENDVLFNGRVSAQSGQFSTGFIVPRDITFSDERGRILVYTKSGNMDGAGSVNNILFNGINEDAEGADSEGPVIDVYLNDPTFVNGNLVGSASMLIIDLEDESGINTTGTGVGHEIIATIDTNPRQTIVLNEFYQSNLDDFRKGRIEYPLDNLSQGSYTLNVRAWDVYNNPEEATIHFEVADSDQLEIRNVYNYPNPMNRNTRFVFEHNQPGNLLDIDIRIYTLSGVPVTHLQESQITSNSYANIEWNGLDRDYDRLANGTYIYVLRVGADTPEGKQTKEKIEKLVIIR